MAKWYITNGILHCDEHLTVTEALRDSHSFVRRDMPDSSRPFDFDENSTALTVPSDVYEIADMTFSLCDKLETVVFNEGLTTIGFGAFYGHKKIRHLAFPDSLVYVDQMAFSAEIRLKDSDMFRLMTEKYLSDADKPSILCTENSAYTCGTMLQSVSFGGSIDLSIEQAAFFGCHRLKDVLNFKDTWSVGVSAFAPFNLLDLVESMHCLRKPSDCRRWYITDGILHCDRFFAPTEDSIPFGFSAEDTALIIPESVRLIAPYTFCACKKLRSLTVSDSVKAIGSRAFCYCPDLETVVLSDGIRLLDANCFGGCHSLREITLPEQSFYTHPLAFSASFTERIEVKGSCRHLAPYTFAGCPKLNMLILPADAALTELPFSHYGTLTVCHADR